MPSRYQPIVSAFPANGGVDSANPGDLLQPNQWVEAINCEYTNTGVPKKRGGTTRYNGTAHTISATATRFTALADFWRYAPSGGVLVGTQKFIGIATTASSGKVVKDDGDGTWDDLGTFGTNSTVPSIVLGQGYAVFLNGSDAPQSWDGTTFGALSGSPPTAAAGTYHLRRMFLTAIAAGTGSTAQYSASGGITDWSGADTGTLTFDEADGDYIVGVSNPFRKNIYFLKGPNVGSIHELSGTSPATFVKSRIVDNGAPCVAARSIVTTTWDVYWASLRGIHSLVQTLQQGDTERGIISRPIQNQFDGMTLENAKAITGFHHPARNIVGWVIPSATDNVVVYNYLTGLWSTWQFATQTIYTAMAARTPATGEPRLYLGTTAGFALAGDQSTKTDVQGATNTAILCRLTSPIFYSVGQNQAPHAEKTLHSLLTIYKPMGTGTVTVTPTIDGTAGSTATVSMTSGSGNAYYAYTPLEGRGHSVQVQYSQNTAAHDMEIHGYAVLGTVDDAAPMDVVAQS